MRSDSKRRHRIPATIDEVVIAYVYVNSNYSAPAIRLLDMQQPPDDLSTASTYTNLPSTAVFSVQTMRMAPSGKLLAVGRHQGLQLFNFTGTSQVTARTGLLTPAEVDQLTWDNSNHLYAISDLAGKLYVFTVTSTGVTPAPGSPYTITKPGRLIVQSK